LLPSSLSTVNRAFQNDIYLEFTFVVSAVAEQCENCFLSDLINQCFVNNERNRHAALNCILKACLGAQTRSSAGDVNVAELCHFFLVFTMWSMRQRLPALRQWQSRA